MKLQASRTELEQAIRLKIMRAQVEWEGASKDPKRKDHAYTYLERKEQWEWILAHLPDGDKVELSWDDMHSMFF